ncbi:MAG: acyl-CoA dehydratase activase [Candidatus Caldarchaeum sp.]
MITVGIDVGTRNTKIAFIEDGGKILLTKTAKTSFDFNNTAKQLFNASLNELGLRSGDVEYIVATGFGRYRVDFRDINVTDITANSRGAKFFYPGTKSVLDIGAGNSRAAKVDEKGKVVKFRSTEKCAAGGGGFLEKIAYYTGFDVADIGVIALSSKNPVPISTVCSVFAESEVINLMTQEVPLEDILMGAHLSVAGRVLVTLKQIGVEPELTITGGLVLNPAIPKVLEEKLNLKPNVSPQLFYAGAVGAAVLGFRRLMKKRGYQAG